MYNGAMAQDTEEWRSVPDFDGLYEVSSLGRVRSLTRIEIYMRAGDSVQSVRRRKGALKSQRLDKDGYPVVNLCRDGKQTTLKVHALVCLAFHGPRPEGHEAAHGNGVRTDNRKGNLRWALQADNIEDRDRHGTTARGERINKAKLSDAAIADIRRRRAGGERVVAIAADYGVTIGAIYHVLNGRTWRHAA